MFLALWSILEPPSIKVRLFPCLGCTELAATQPGGAGRLSLRPPRNQLGLLLAPGHSLLPFSIHRQDRVTGPPFPFTKSLSPSTFYAFQSFGLKARRTGEHLNENLQYTPF
jgi:hypothetical protein